MTHGICSLFLSVSACVLIEYRGCTFLFLVALLSAIEQELWYTKKKTCRNSNDPMKQISNQKCFSDKLAIVVAFIVDK